MSPIEPPSKNGMTKADVLAIFARAGGYLKPDDILLPSRPNRRSLYSYLLRLQRQGLLERMPGTRRGQLAYRITQRGRDRLAYLRRA